MAIEPLQIKSGGSANINGFGTNQVQKPQTLEDILERRDEQRAEEKRAEKRERDRLSLSDSALEYLYINDPKKAQALVEAQLDEKTQSENIITQNALELRGFAQLAQRRNLTDREIERVGEIRDTLQEAGVSDEDALELAEKTLQNAQTQATDLVQLLSDNNITGDQFNRLNQINSLLNKSNGFGSEEVEGALQFQVNNLTERFNELIQENSEKVLSEETVKNLEALEKQISAIQGYQLNVKDTVGKNGIVL